MMRGALLRSQRQEMRIDWRPVKRFVSGQESNNQLHARLWDNLSSCLTLSTPPLHSLYFETSTLGISGMRKMGQTEQEKERSRPKFLHSLQTWKVRRLPRRLFMSSDFIAHHLGGDSRWPSASLSFGEGRSEMPLPRDTLEEDGPGGRQSPFSPK